MINQNPDMMEEEAVPIEGTVDAPIMIPEEGQETFTGEEQDVAINLGRIAQQGQKLVGDVLSHDAPPLPAGIAPEAKPATIAPEAASLDSMAPPPEPRVGDLTDPAEAWAPNFNKSSDYLDTYDDIKAVLDGTHREFDFDSFNRMTPQSHSVTREKALAMDGEQFFEEVIGRKEGEIFNAEKIDRARLLMVSLAEEVYESGRGIATMVDGRWKIHDGADEVQLFEWRKKVNTLAAVQFAVEGSVKEAARATNAMQMKVGSSYLDAQNMVGKVRSMGGVHGTERLLNNIMSTEGTGDLRKATRMAKVASVPDRVWNVIQDLYYFGMLSAPTTHIKNISGNALVSVVAVPERYMGSIWGKIFSYTGANKAAELTGKALGKMGSKKWADDLQDWGLSAEDAISVRQANHMAYGTVEGWVDAFGMLADSFKKENEEVALGGRSMIDRGHVAWEDSSRARGINSRNIGVSPEGMTGKFLDFVGDYIIGGNSRLLEGEDQFFKTINYKAALRARSVKEAEQMEGDVRVNAKMLAEKWMNEAPPEDIQNDLMQHARVQTFTDDLESPIGQGAMKMASVPIVKIFVPFIKTVSNIAKYGMQRTPLVGQMFPSFWRDMAAGGTKRDMAMAKASTGGIMAGFAHSWMQGESVEVTDDYGVKHTVVLPRVTGAGAQNYNTQKLMKKAGWMPYSFRDPETGKYTPYNWIEPFGTILGAQVSMIEAYSNTYKDVDREEMLESIVLGFAEYTTSKSYMQGFADFMQVMEGRRSFTQVMAKTAATMTAPNVLTGIRKEADDVRRGSDAGGFWDMFKNNWQNRIPWLSENVAPYVDAWGEEMKYGDPAWGLYSISPYYGNHITDDEITKELARLYKPALGESSADRFAMHKPRSVVKLQMIDEETGVPAMMPVDLKEADPSGWAYAEYQMVVGKARREEIEKPFNSGAWDAWTEDRKYSEANKAFTRGKRKVDEMIAIQNVNFAGECNGDVRCQVSNFIQKYSDIIAAEGANRMQQQLDVESAPYDYTRSIEDENVSRMPDAPSF